jgi:outer membrane receptor for ferrienterochelin and colicins
MKTFGLLLIFFMIHNHANAQNGVLKGTIKGTNGEAIGLVSIISLNSKQGTISNNEGSYELSKLATGKHIIKFSYMGYETHQQEITLDKEEVLTLDIVLSPSVNTAIDEVVITGTMREISRLNSPVPVEIITAQLFKKNPTPSLFDAVGMVNGVQPQLNCNVCNTGDIHINGMEGPYTMILIDGMPIVSALSTVYGLSGIPNSMVDRIEVVKGPASSLYGSEAMGGIINVITKSPLKAPIVSLDFWGTGWGETSADAAIKFKVGESSSLLGANYFNYQNPIDKNGDNFTDLTLQKRLSIFNKWNFERSDNRLASIAGRYVYEDRWGGEMNWNKTYRGGDQVYGESIYTRRGEMIGLYQLPTNERILSQFSYNWHQQDSWYGTTPFKATQHVAFVQSYWDKPIGKKHNLLTGAAFRFTGYDDNTPATASPIGQNQPTKTALPGIFLQDEWSISSKHTLLSGYRYDYDKNHGSIHSPRLAYKFSPDQTHTLRASFGTGFRVVNLFTEDHAALTGARKVELMETLNPERSVNSNLNYVFNYSTKKLFFNMDITGFYSYFSNKIVGDFDSDPNKIIYENLDGHAVSQGVSLNTHLTFSFPLKITSGITYMDVYLKEHDENQNLLKSVQLHAPKWSGNFILTYALPKKFSVDFTGNWYGPMRLPILPHDYRPEYSPWFSIANIQLTKGFNNGIELYGGLKNLFNFVPKDPIMRPFDPFDKLADDPINNPNGYTFDPSYNYSSLQGLRYFIGLRYNLF